MRPTIGSLTIDPWVEGGETIVDLEVVVEVVE